MSAARWAKRIVIGGGMLAAVAVTSGAGYEQLMRKHSLRDFPVPGRLIDVGGGRHIQLDCRGAGAPTVVLESGLDFYGSLSWSAVHDSIAAITRVCAYSRSGIMWSDPAAGPFDSRAVAGDLHAALIGAGETPSWVMVGHSLGGPYVAVFTQLYDGEVSGVVLVDPTHPDQFARYREIAGKSLMPSAGEVRFGAAVAWTGLVRVTSKDQVPSTWPRDIGKAGSSFLSTSVAGLAREVEAISTTLRTAAQLRSLGDRPLIVLTAGRAAPPAERQQMGITEEQAKQLRVVSSDLHENQAAQSRRGRHIIVPDASHYIQFDRPDVVTRAVRDVVEAARAQSKINRDADTPAATLRRMQK